MGHFKTLLENTLFSKITFCCAYFGFLILKAFHQFLWRTSRAVNYDINSGISSGVKITKSHEYFMEVSQNVHLIIDNDGIYFFVRKNDKKFCQKNHLVSQYYRLLFLSHRVSCTFPQCIWWSLHVPTGEAYVLIHHRPWSEGPWLATLHLAGCAPGPQTWIPLPGVTFA